MPHEPLDASEDLPKEAPRQVALGELEPEVPGMPDQATAGLEEPLLEARQGLVLDGERQANPAQEIAEIVCDDPEEQPHPHWPGSGPRSRARSESVRRASPRRAPAGA